MDKRETALVWFLTMVCLGAIINVANQYAMLQ